MGLRVSHLAGDQGTGFNPDSVLLSSERFPCHPLGCVFGWPVLEGRAVPFLGCRDEAPPPSSQGQEPSQPLRAGSSGQRSIRRFLLVWQLQLGHGQALECPREKLGTSSWAGAEPALSSPSEQPGHLRGHRQIFDFLILVLLLII